jgi:hypothetical protein
MSLQCYYFVDAFDNKDRRIYEERKMFILSAFIALSVWAVRTHDVWGAVIGSEIRINL